MCKLVQIECPNNTQKLHKGLAWVKKKIKNKVQKETSYKTVWISPPNITLTLKS